MQRVALVTGANRGIGEAIASALSAQNVRVLAAARTEGAAAAAAARIGAAAGVELPLSDPSRASAALSTIVAAHGPIDILVNNAGVLLGGDARAMTRSDLAESLAVMVASPAALIGALAPGMADRGYGRIVNLSSGWGAFAEGLGGPAAYAIAKAALNASTVVYARSFGPAVKINAACPGWVRTRMGGDGAARSPAEGADTPLWLATLPEDGPTGGFFRDRAPIDW